LGQGHDWNNIAEVGRPSVRADVDSANLADSDLIPVPTTDLGEAVGASERFSINRADLGSPL